MQKILTKINFYSTLNLIYLNILKGSFTVPDKNFIQNSLPLKRTIHFFVPDNQNQAGARVIIFDVYAELIRQIKKLKLPWSVSISSNEPTKDIDILICFKCLPKKFNNSNRKNILLICDQAELFWDDIKKFDYVVATSSEPFARLLSQKNKKTFFISESETNNILNIGKKNLKFSPSSRQPFLLWHGGKYSLDPLIQLLPLLEDFRKKNDFKILMISGNEPEKKYMWGKILVHQFPWSYENFISQVSQARLGFIPAKSSIKGSFLKPASRIRSLYALGTPSIGDERVPDVKKFMDSFGGPMASNKEEWLYKLEMLWNSKSLDEIAFKGWSTVRDSYTDKETAKQWINFLLKID